MLISYPSPFNGRDVSHDAPAARRRDLRCSIVCASCRIRLPLDGLALTEETLFDERTGRIIAIGVEDNLVKGAAGQAIQSFNLVHGLSETAGLDQLPLAP